MICLAGFWGRPTSPSAINIFGIDSDFGLWLNIAVKGVKQRLRWIEACELWMGSNDEERARITDEPYHDWVQDESPRHRVRYAWGLFDCDEQVWEWCSDFRRSYEQTAMADGFLVDPMGPRDEGKGAHHALRGSSFRIPARDARSAYRRGIRRGLRDHGLGQGPKDNAVHAQCDHWRIRLIAQP